MKIPYICPHQIRYDNFPYIVCGKQIKNGVDYSKAVNAVTALCTAQEYCACSGKSENTEEAKKCPIYLADKG